MIGTYWKLHTCLSVYKSLGEKKKTWKCQNSVTLTLHMYLWVKKAFGHVGADCCLVEKKETPKYIQSNVTLTQCKTERTNPQKNQKQE